ncbi:transcriptional regulator [Opitutaceae bacterium TAV1]|nr:transcriptional regulator [Opitutaceae bacterium TAV5]EIP97115.1 transcriptional regulator [Opitutaceae bacterium TAV1]
MIMDPSTELRNIDEATRYQAAKNMLRRKVLSGEVGHGEQLQPELELCREINLSRTTVRKAIADLVNEGLLVRYRGRGTFVNIRRSPVQKKLLALLLCQAANVSGAYDLLTQGARQAASKLGYQLLLANSQNEEQAALSQAIMLNEHKVAGTIVVPLQTPAPDVSTEQVIRALVRTGQKVIMADGYSGSDDVPSVCSQNREAMYTLTSHLIARGYRRIAFLTSYRVEVVQEREDGFRRAMAEHGLEIPPEYFLEVGSRDPARQGIQEVDVFMAMRKRPEAIVCLHDLIALNVIRRCEERGWSVPRDVAVTGFDDLPQAARSDPPLTTMHQPLRALGTRAVELLVQCLREEPLPVLHERLPCRLIVRQSCGSSSA